MGSEVSEDGFILRQRIVHLSNTLIFINSEVTLRQGFQQVLQGENIYEAPEYRWLDMKSYAEGMYIILVTAGKKTGSKKLILHH